MTILHTLRCVGFVAPERLVEVTGLAEADIEAELIDLAAAGLVSREFGSWGLTEAGRDTDARNVAAELEKAGTRADLAAAYDRFLPLNKEMLDVCTAWQLLPSDGAMKLNDHTDPAYDALVLDRLADFHHRADVVLAEFSAALRRFERYRVRLAAALEQLDRGFTRYFTDDFASYHIVWFQLHEDVLATLGIPR
ncbi:transcriptional regulator [Fodinicola acaciae]|uniref:transcriptional regulator n=1 Tax=Fodinicola acaciae TaxID=2681555 RepID=UPI0013D552F0|nr:transcriptional regulator [Fodinicola acaciae]